MIGVLVLYYHYSYYSYLWTLPRSIDLTWCRHIARYLPTNPSSYVSSKCMYQFQDPISPHLAVKNASQVRVSPCSITLDLIQQSRRYRYLPQTIVSSKGFDTTYRNALDLSCNRPLLPLWLVCSSRPLEVRLIRLFPCFYLLTPRLLLLNYQGVHSPTPAGTSQAQAYRPLRLPILLVGDSRLGGISSTIAAYESLYIRGYTIDRILLFRNDRYRNHEYLTEHFAPLDIGLTLIPPPPLRDEVNDEQTLREWYTEIASSTSVRDLLVSLDETHQKRYKKLEDLPRRALDTIWYPFVQHKNVKSPKDIIAVDSAYRDAFTIYRSFTSPRSALSPSPSSSSPSSPSAPTSPSCPPNPTSDLVPYFDGSASWWTQCIGHGHPALALTASNAAGRYGHVISAQTATSPSTDLAERLLATHGIGAGWASRVFFSDNGSTGMEVAVKMALRAVTARYGAGSLGDPLGDLGVLGITGSYHGDTIGAMDMCEGGAFNSEVEWYKGRGFWFNAPCVGIKDGVVSVEPSTWMRTKATKFRTLSEVHNVSTRLGSELANTYATCIREKLRALCVDDDSRYGALVLEPLLLGAGGMKFIDPLFQRVLIDVVRSSEDVLFPGLSPRTVIPPSRRWRGLPLIYDEVFTGLGRLGSYPSLVLGTNPDIAVYAKVLTGGLVPLSATLATADIFEGFLDERKSRALLHGHSYTAYPVGCAVANKSLELLEVAMQGREWRDAKKMWARDEARMCLGMSAAAAAFAFAREFWYAGLGMKTDVESRPTPSAWSLWSPSFVYQLSHSPWVNKVCALGTVLAFEVTPNTSGHHFTGTSFLSSLSRSSSSDFGHTTCGRPLGGWSSTQPKSFPCPPVGVVRDGRMTPLFPAPLSISRPLTAASLHSARSLHIYPCLRPVPTSDRLTLT